jgi:hypothetical protein
MNHGTKIYASVKVYAALSAYRERVVLAGDVPMTAAEFFRGKHLQLPN